MNYRSDRAIAEQIANHYEIPSASIDELTNTLKEVKIKFLEARAGSEKSVRGKTRPLKALADTLHKAKNTLTVPGVRDRLRIAAKPGINELGATGNDVRPRGSKGESRLYSAYLPGDKLIENRLDECLKIVEAAAAQDARQLRSEISQPEIIAAAAVLAAFWCTILKREVVLTDDAPGPRAKRSGPGKFRVLNFIDDVMFGFGFKECSRYVRDHRHDVEEYLLNRLGVRLH